MAQTTLLSATLAALLSSAMARQFVLYTPGGDDTAVERIDPIMSPGKISGHVHQVFGSNNLNPELSYESLQQSDCTTLGSADGQAIAQDKSIYWHPALYMEGNDGGYVKVPLNGHKLYYRDTGCGQESGGCGFPKGFRMIAGDPFNRSPVSSNALKWTCYNGGENAGAGGAFPTGVTNCADYPYLMGLVEFPHCWNGNDFDPSDPSAHTAYPEGDPIGGSCPSSHPKALPHITMENLFQVDAVAGKVKQDSFVLAQGDNTGYGWHADFFNGWDEGAIDDLMGSCPQGEFGNADVGTCSGFKSSSSTSSCSLPVTFKENVESPGSQLPGCNEVLKNPSPNTPIAALNQHCGGNSAGGESSAAPSGSAYPSASSGGSPPASSQPAESQPVSSAAPSSPAETSYAASSTPWATTFATSTSGYAAASTALSHTSRKGGHSHYGHGHHHARPTWWGRL